MTVSAVGQSDNSKLYTIIQTSAAGAVGGYASKYILPVTKQENTINTRTMLNYCRKITNNAKVADLNALGDKKTLAQDAFSFKNIQENVKALGGESSLAGKEFRSLVREVDSVSKNLTRKFAKAYNFMLKDIRPTAPFIVTGAGIGFFAGFAHNVFKTDIDA